MNKKREKIVPYAMSVKDLSRLLDEPWNEIAARIPLSFVDKSTVTSSLSSAEMRAIVDALGVHVTPQTLAFINLKGGVGKTTSAVTLASRAVQWGFKTCILDLDAQASATLMLGIEPGDEDLVFCDLWNSPQEKLPSAIKKIQENFYLIPSALDNSLLDVQLASPMSQKIAVAGVCQALRDLGFDLVVIDCPPSLGTAVISTICAADTLVIPVTTDAFSRKGLELTIDEVTSIRETFGLGAIDLKVLPTMIDRRLKLTEQALSRLEASHGDLLLPGVIRTSSEFAKSLESHTSIFASGRSNNAKEDYDRIVGPLLKLSALY